MLIKLHNYINQSLRRRLLFFLVPYTVLLLASMTFFSYTSFFSTLKQEEENSTRTLVSQIRDNFDYYFQDIKNIMAFLSINVDVQQALTLYETLSFEDQYYLEIRINESISNVNVFKSFINDIIIIGKNGYTHNLPNSFSLNEAINLSESEWLQNYHPSANSYFGFTAPHQADYYEVANPNRWVVSAILPLKIRGRDVGFLQGDIDYEELRDVLDTVYRQNEIEITVVASDGVIVLDRDIDKVNSQFAPEVFNELEGTQGSFVNNQQASNSLIVYLQSEVTDWYLVATIPYSILLAPSYAVSKTVLFFILPISLLIALALLFFLTEQWRQPWKKLLHRIETVTVSNYEPAEIDYGTGEIAELGYKFEGMLAHNNQLIEQVYLAEIKKKNAELRALREQITPHFLYNSLQIVKAEAMLSKNKEISQTVTAIANLLHYSLDNHKSQVIVADEINYIHDYLDIYRRRFIGKFEYEIDVAEEIMGYTMQKMILQPLVENCIKHGLEHMKSGGCIQIWGRRDGDGCIFNVQDNGKGISSQKREQLTRQLEETDEITVYGIGLFNVHQRVTLAHGPDYGIREIDSKEGEYTRVVLKT